VSSDRVLVPAAILLAVTVGTVLPIVRSLRKHGTSGVTIHRRPSLAQRIVGAIVGLLGALSIVWALLLAVLGGGRVGVFQRSPLVGAVGWAAFGAGLLLVVLAQAQMRGAWRIGIDRERTELVTSGLYARIRNPIYTGAVLIAAGIAMLTPAPWTIASAIAYLVMIRVQTAFEEEHLTTVHGDAYRAYLARVGRFVPRLGRG
jgi:protein-S-isoprenylcysteine O-methyltransferase Ste14